MSTFAEHLTAIEIDTLWAGKKHIRWTLDRHVNILSGANGMGKSTIVNKVVGALTTTGALPRDHEQGVHLSVEPSSATHIYYDVIRSIDRPLLNAEVLAKVNLPLATELDWQLYALQRRYLDYQVNIANRIIALLQGQDNSAQQHAQQLAQHKTLFFDLVDHFFADTKKQIVRSENELVFTQGEERITTHQLSAGEKQLLIILLTALVEDNKPYVLFMDEPEVSLHVEWQQQLIKSILQMNKNVQIVMTTHSPAVIMQGWRDNVTEVAEIEVG